jgi:DNA-binding CsgD family transcriptional regulator
LVKSIARLQRVEAQRRPAAAVFIRDPQHNFEPSLDVLRMLFDFTAAEARFARLLASGMSMEDGRRLGITRNTCKSRLQAIFAKTGVTRQAALVGVLHDTLVSL